MLGIDIEFRKGVLFVRLEGILNNETVNKLNREVLDTIKINGIKYIVFNLENLYYIDMEGISAIMNHYNLINSYHGKSLICGICNNIVKNRIRQSDILEYISETNNELSALRTINI